MCKASLLFFMVFLSFIADAQTDRVGYDAATNDPHLTPARLSFEVKVHHENDSCFNIWILNPDKKKLHLSISNSYLGTIANTTIYKETYSCRYRLDNVEDGRYQIIVRCGKEKFTKEIELKTSTTRTLEIN